MNMSRRTLLAGAAAAAAGITIPGPALAQAGSYGSGVHGGWATKSKAISAESQIRSVLTQDGVFSFGDSLGVQDGHSLALRLHARSGDLMAVNNWSGRPTAPTVDALGQWAAEHGLPTRVLMAVGSNDIFDPPGFRAEVERAMSIVGSGVTLHWVNIQVSRWAESPTTKVADQRNTGWINTQLEQATLAWPNLQIVRWFEFLASRPGYRIPNYLSDGLHTAVPLGQDARNEMIVQALT